MCNTIHVVIGGKGLSLLGDDEQVIREAALQVQSQWETLRKQHKDESDNTISLLAAINVYAKYYKKQMQEETDKDFFVKELKRMEAYLLENFKDNIPTNSALHVTS